MAGTEETVLKGEPNPRPQFSSVNQVRMKNKKEGKKKNDGQIINSDDPQDGDPRADTKEHQSKVLQFGALDNTVKAARYTTYAVRGRSLPPDYGEGGIFIEKQVAHSSSEESNEDMIAERGRSLPPVYGEGGIYIKCLCSGKISREPVNRARFSILDEDRIADERGRSSPPDHGGGRRLTVNQSEKKDVGQTRFASRGIAISTTPIQTDSNLMQSNGEATSEVSNNDTPTSRHLSTDHPNQEKKIGCMSMLVRKRKRNT